MRKLKEISCGAVFTGALGLITAVVPSTLVSPVWARALPMQEELQSSSRSDLAIESDVLRQLAVAPGLGGQRLSASTADGVVTLSGTVADDAAKSLAERTVSGVAGVRSVVNKLGVGSGSQPGATQSSPVAQDSDQPTAAQDAEEVAKATGVQDEVSDGENTAQQQAPATQARKPSPAVPAQSESHSAPQAQPDAGTQGDWGQAGPPPDAQGGRIPQQDGEAAGAQGQYPQPSPQQEQQPYPSQGGQYPQPQGQTRTYPQPNSAPYPQYPQQYPNSQTAPYPAPQQAPYPSQGGYGDSQTGRDRTSGYPPQSQPSYGQYAQPSGGYGQYPPAAGGYPRRPQPQYQSTEPLSIPPGTVLAVRTVEPLDTRRLQPGDVFQTTAARDVYEGSVLAIPRGATLTGRVVDVKRAGAFKGSAGMALQLVSIDMSGRSFPLATDIFATDTRGKGGYTAANAAGGAIVGAMIGAVAGGGPGAAIGAVTGGGMGAGISAATPGPREVMPPETLLNFHLAAPVTVIPVSYQEAQRLAALSVPTVRPYVRPRPAVYPYPPPPPPRYYGYPYYR